MPETGRPTIDSRGGTQGDPFNMLSGAKNRKGEHIDVGNRDVPDSVLGRSAAPIDAAASAVSRGVHEHMSRQASAPEQKPQAPRHGYDKNGQGTLFGAAPYKGAAGAKAPQSPEPARGEIPGQGSLLDTPAHINQMQASAAPVEAPQPGNAAVPSVPMPGFSSPPETHATETAPTTRAPQPGFSSPEATGKPTRSRAAKRNTAPKLRFSDSGVAPTPEAASGPVPSPGFSSPAEVNEPRKASAPAPQPGFSSAPEAQRTRQADAAPSGRTAQPFAEPSAPTRAERSGAPEVSHDRASGGRMTPGDTRGAYPAQPKPQTARQAAAQPAPGQSREPQPKATGRGGQAGAVHNHYYNTYNQWGDNHGSINANGAGGSGGGARGARIPAERPRSGRVFRDQDSGGSPASPAPYGKATLGQKVGYAVVNSHLDGHRSLNDVAAEHTGHTREFYDKSGNRIGDRRTDAKKAYQASEHQYRDAAAQRLNRGYTAQRQQRAESGSPEPRLGMEPLPSVSPSVSPNQFRGTAQNGQALRPHERARQTLPYGI
jgi:hypothetical protein